MGRKLTLLSLKQKLEILNKFKDKGQTAKELAVEYKCDVSTIRRICRNEKNVRENCQKNNIKRKRLRKSVNNRVDLALTKWFLSARENNAVVTGPILMEKAKQLAIKLNTDFHPSSGWLWRWKKRHNIVFKKVQGEQNDADTVEAKEYVEKILPSILQNYKAENIFNADESGLFYKMLPNGTFTEKNKEAKGGKMQKVRLTLLFLCNATASYKKVFVIGKGRNPRCFKNKQICLPYYSNKNAWMTSEIWMSILSDFDKEMTKARRKVVLFIDNASCHKISINCESVRVEFLPANTTSLIQPLDQGIIHSFKAYYRQTIIRKQVLSIESGQTVKEFLKSITLLDILYYIKRSCWLVKETSIRNCFKKAGFIISEVNQQQNKDSWDDDEQVLLDVPSSVEQEFDQYIKCDDNLICYGDKTDEDIIQEIINETSEGVCEEETHSDGERNAEDSSTPVTVQEAIKALNIIEKFLTYHNIDTEEIERVEEKMYKLSYSNHIQKKITDYY